MTTAEREFSGRQWYQPNDVVTWRQSDKHAILLSGDESKAQTFHQDASWKYQDGEKVHWEVGELFKLYSVSALLVPNGGQLAFVKGNIDDIKAFHHRENESTPIFRFHKSNKRKTIQFNQSSKIYSKKKVNASNRCLRSSKNGVRKTPYEIPTSSLKTQSKIKNSNNINAKNSET